jgi:hypothetical protein
MVLIINPSEDIPLVDFLKSRTQVDAAAIMGVTQGAVHQMMRDKRDIFFTPKPDGGFDHYEIKKPRRKKAA